MMLAKYTALELAALVGRREISPSEILADVLSRVSIHDSSLGAFRTVDAERATNDAERLTAEIARGNVRSIFHGIPVAVKELIDVAGLPTTYGSQVPRTKGPELEGEVIAKLRTLGAVIIGTTKSHEYGWGITTQHSELGGTRNPWNRSFVPGGSSGGSAAALAAGFTPIALGSDTGGSIRIPASYCGVFGLKPSFGILPTSGVVPLAPSFDHLGLMARSLADLVMTLAALKGGLELTQPLSSQPWSLPDPQTCLSGGALVIGYSLEGGLIELHTDYRARISSVLSQLSDAGHALKEVQLPPAEFLLSTFGSIQGAEAHHVHSTLLATYPLKSELYGRDVRERLQRGSTISLETYISSIQHRQSIAKSLSGIFADVDILITPITGGPPSTIAEPDHVVHSGIIVPFRDQVMGHTVLHNLVGIPSLAIPIAFDEQGVPIGLQLAARFGQDRFLLDSIASLNIPHYSAITEDHHT